MFVVSGEMRVVVFTTVEEAGVVDHIVRRGRERGTKSTN